MSYRILSVRRYIIQPHRTLYVAAVAVQRRRWWGRLEHAVLEFVRPSPTEWYIKSAGALVNAPPGAVRTSLDNIVKNFDELEQLAELRAAEEAVDLDFPTLSTTKGPYR